jgi:hypothetical protein
MSDSIGAAESTFADFAHRADTYTGSGYAAAVNRRVNQQRAVMAAVAEFQDRVG